MVLFSPLLATLLPSGNHGVSIFPCLRLDLPEKIFSDSTAAMAPAPLPSLPIPLDWIQSIAAAQVLGLVLPDPYSHTD